MSEQFVSSVLKELGLNNNNNISFFEITFLTPERERKIINYTMYKSYDIIGNNLIFEDASVFNGVIKLIFGGLKNGIVNIRISVVNNTENIIESVTLPQLLINCNMIDSGGEDYIFWPSMEGTIIERASNEHVEFVEKNLGGGYHGVTPGAAAMQYMAFFSPNVNIYMGAHDEHCELKDFEYFFEDENTVRIFCKIYPGGCRSYDMQYDMVLRTFKGDWQDAAEIYRSWMCSSDLPLPKKLKDRTDLPKWLADSPVTMLYPVRGTKDTDRDEKMAPNCYYPYSNILPVLDDYADKFDNKILSLMMHWEGSAPWCTPYIWPPYGDRDDFDYTVSEIHKRGHLVGLYASGLGITTQAVTDSSYINTDEFENGGWKECVCKDYKGSSIFTDLGFVRSGYDVCPSCEKVKETVINEAMKIADADIDYFQAFDQNLGGIPKFCWSEEHSHPSAPGNWITDNMTDIFRRMEAGISSANKNMVFGCEGAASEPAMKFLPFNDLRWFTAYMYGKPVAAYSYLYHEYINNYMGNQNGLQWMLDLDAAPDNLLYRTAYSFINGDMLTIVLGDNGKISWCWNAPFDGSYPDQSHIIGLIRNAVNWRKNFEKYLRFGKMLKCGSANCERSVAVVTGYGKKIYEDNVLTRKYMADDGSIAQFFVNRTSSAQRLILSEFDNDKKLYLSSEKSVDIPDEIVLEPTQIICVL